MYYKLGQACVTNWGPLFYYELGQTLLQTGTASLLQIRASFVTNFGSYYWLGKTLLQNRVAITNWSKTYYKLGQVLQIRAIISDWGIRNTWLFLFVNISGKLSTINENTSRISEYHLYRYHLVLPWLPQYFSEGLSSSTKTWFSLKLKLEK